MERAQLDGKIRELLDREKNSDGSYFDQEAKEILKEILILNDTLKTKERWLSEAQKIAKIGYWEFDFNKNSIYWSDESS